MSGWVGRLTRPSSPAPEIMRERPALRLVTPLVRSVKTAFSTPPERSARRVHL
nr:hypothetical protein [Streptomyces sp. NRRL S-340]